MPCVAMPFTLEGVLEGGGLSVQPRKHENCCCSSPQGETSQPEVQTCGYRAKKKGPLGNTHWHSTLISFRFKGEILLPPLPLLPLLPPPPLPPEVRGSLCQVVRTLLMFRCNPRAHFWVLLEQWAVFSSG